MGLRLQYAGHNPVEQVTLARAIIDSNHGQVHAKAAFEFAYSKQLTAGGVMAVAIQVPAEAYIHFQSANLIYAGAIKFELLEGSTFANGSVAVPHNKHRVDPPASVLTITKDVNTIAGGTDLMTGPVFLGAAGTPSRTSIGGATGESSEWVLKPSTTYIFRVTSLEGTATINVTQNFFWYEETGY
jgi:hypothetical protein